MSVKWKSGINAPQYGKPGHVAPLKHGNHAPAQAPTHDSGAVGGPSGAAGSC